MNKIDPTSKPAKYFYNKVKGMNKKEAALAAGYSPMTAQTATTAIESTKTYQLLKKAMDEHLATDKELFEEHRKIIKQDRDLSAKTKAVNMAYKLKDLYPKDDKDLNPTEFILVVRRRK